MQCDIDSLNIPTSWEAAHRLFGRIPPLRGKLWDEDLRPLGNNRQWHYRMQQYVDGSYALWLFHTCMVRYEKPEGDTRRVHLQYDSRKASRGFLHRAGFPHGTCFDTVDGRKVFLYYHDTATLVFQGHLLDTAASTNRIPLKVPYTSIARRKVRKERLALWATLFKMMQLRGDPESSKDWKPRLWLRYTFGDGVMTDAQISDALAAVDSHGVAVATRAVREAILQGWPLKDALLTLSAFPTQEEIDAAKKYKA